MYVATVPEPLLATRHPAARELSRGRQGQIAHARQSDPLAGGQGRSAYAALLQGRAQLASPAEQMRDRALAAARPCRRGARHGAQTRPAIDCSPRQAQAARHLALAMIVARVIEPAAKLATARQLTRRRRPTRWATCSTSARSTRTNSTPRSTGSGRPNRRSRRRSPGGICRTARWCSTTSPRPIWRGVVANWPSTATAATADRTSRRSSSACCAPPMAARSRSRCSRATPPTRRRWPRRSTS